jgi:hypothetical protein
VSVDTLLLIVIVTFAFGFVLGLLLAAIREQYNQLHAMHMLWGHAQYATSLPKCHA